MRKFLSLLVGACVGAFSVAAQTNYAIFKDSAQLLPADTGRLSLEIDNLNYLRNYEYFGDIPLSYTLLGNQLMPQLKYQLNENFSLKGGLFLRREFGLKGFTNITPVLTANYQKRGVSFLVGTLQGAANHQFIEPLYDAESIINDRIEQGVQVVINKPKLWLDWYIDWEKAIVRQSSYPEEFTTGISGRFTIHQTEKIAVTLPAQAMVAHKGGQIDTSNLAVESLLNTAAGVSVLVNKPTSFLKSIEAAHYLVSYKDLSGDKKQAFRRGKGMYSALIFKTAFNLDIDARYWSGDGFYGPRGGALYSSISEKVPGYAEQKRNLLFLSFIYDRPLCQNVWLDLRMEPYYDLRNHLLEYSYSVFLRFKKEFTLRRVK